LKSIAHFVKVTVRMLFAKAFFRLRRLRSSALLLATRRQILRNAGSFFILSMVSNVAHDIDA
jgi:hypothetical protein